VLPCMYSPLGGGSRIQAFWPWVSPCASLSSDVVGISGPDYRKQNDQKCIPYEADVNPLLQGDAHFIDLSCECIDNSMYDDNINYAYDESITHAPAMHDDLAPAMHHHHHHHHHCDNHHCSELIHELDIRQVDPVCVGDSAAILHFSPADGLLDPSAFAASALSVEQPAATGLSSAAFVLPCGAAGHLHATCSFSSGFAVETTTLPNGEHVCSECGSAHLADILFAAGMGDDFFHDLIDRGVCDEGAFDVLRDPHMLLLHGTLPANNYGFFGVPYFRR
jgi:hypothetical protein